MKKEYLIPETEELFFRTQEALLLVSTLTGTSTGEDVTVDSEYDPW